MGVDPPKPATEVDDSALYVQKRLAMRKRERGNSTIEHFHAPKQHEYTKKTLSLPYIVGMLVSTCSATQLCDHDKH